MHHLSRNWRAAALSCLAAIALATIPSMASAQCGSRSPLACGAVPVALPFQLGWGADEGGIVDGVAVGTGFTVVESHSNNFDPIAPSNPALNGYEPGFLQVDTGAGLLKVTASRGIPYRDPSQSANTNSLVNGLGVGVDVSSQAVRIETVLTSLPAATNSAEQAGLWVWLDEDNLSKLVAISTGGSNYKFQLQVEDYPPTATGFPATTGAPLEINTAGFNMSGQSPKLILIIDPTPTPSITGFYNIGAGDVLIGSFPQASNAAGTTSTCAGGVCPTPGTEFFTGVDHDSDGGTANVTFLGVYATQRNNANVTPRLVYSFDSFSIQSFCTVDADCNDFNACNGTETCAANTCVAGSPLVCNDGNICTDDSCDPGTGCQFINNTDPCSDGSLCTTGDTCGGGACQPGAPVTCDDSNGCTDDSCNPGSGCQFVNNTDPCDDADACTDFDTCGGGTCQGTPIVCDDSNVCTTDSCDSGLGCQAVNNANPCDDLDACTDTDTCAGGTCQGAAISCDDSNVCTDDSCNPSVGCEYANNTDPCDDANVCTTGDTCVAGVCEAGPSVCPFDCTPENSVELGTQTKISKIKYKGANSGRFKTKGAFVSADDLNIDSSDVTIGMTDSLGIYYETTLPAGELVTSNGKTFKFKDKAPYELNGLQKTTIKVKGDGQTHQYNVGAKDLDLSGVGGLPTGAGLLAVKIGDKCFIDNSHACTNSSSGTLAKCQ